MTTETMVYESNQGDLIETEIGPIHEWAVTLKIGDNNQFIEAVERRRTLKTIRKKIDEMFDSGIKKAFEAHRAAVAVKKRFTDRIDDADSSIGEAVKRYNDEQERKRIEEQRKLDAEAKRKEDEERKRIEKKIEAAKKAGNEEKVEALTEQKDQVFVPPPIAIQRIPEVKGLSFREDWKAVVEDKSKVPEEYKIVDVSMLNKFAKATKGAISVPGVRFFSEKIPVQRI